jgi:2-oxo-4-hydroxy-4-carboxy--5-ureidoimidazoline (OHCU) decarboxylase
VRPELPEIGEIDEMGSAAFVETVGPLFEGTPGYLWRLAAARPFGSWDSLFLRARAIVHAMPEPFQVDLIDSHPRLGAPPATVSALSFHEQGYGRAEAANLASETARERDRVAAELDRMNREYEATFGFRYCVFVAGRPHPELLPEMAAALDRQRDAELHRALDAVVDIAADRWRAGRGA